MIFALDASSTAVGWCIASGDKYIDSGVFVPRSKKFWSRLAEIRQWLDDQLLDNRITVLAYEEPHGHHGNAATDRKLGVVMGIAFSAAGRAGIRFAGVHNAQVVASGICKKTDVAIVEQFIGKSLDAKNPGDEADAIGVWLAYRNHCK